MAGLVTEDKFNELVNSTTHYLQDLVNRVQQLEDKIESIDTVAFLNELDNKTAKKKEAK